MAAKSDSFVWRLENPHVVGGHSTEVLGEPMSREDVGGRAIFFDGVDDGLFVPVNPLAGATAFTVEILFKPDSAGPDEQRFFHLQDERGNRALLETRMIEGRWALDTFLSSVDSKQKRILLDRTKTHPADRWTWVALVYRDGHLTHYIDGVKELDGAVEFPPLAAGRFSLGVRQNKVYWFKGGLREVRFHRTAVPAEELQRVRRETPPPTADAATPALRH